jgi:hypothetical protein
MNLATLIPAILTYVREKGGFTTKTKLLKMLYLLDIEAFRKSQSTLTGFDWIFYRYGPWADKYDAVLSELESAGSISLRSGSRSDLDTVFLDATEKVALGQAFKSFVDELAARRIIEAWADRPTGELLEYVYFHTAPMRNADRGKPLDFGPVLQEDVAPVYKGVESKIEPAILKQKRKEFRERLKASADAKTAPTSSRPNYDSEFWKALDTMDRDPD